MQCYQYIIKYMGIVICNLQLASRSSSTESETKCEEKIDEAGEAFVENHITQQTLASYLGKSWRLRIVFFWKIMLYHQNTKLVGSFFWWGELV